MAIGGALGNVGIGIAIGTAIGVVAMAVQTSNLKKK